MDRASDIAARVRPAELGNGTRVFVLESRSNVTVDVIGLLDGGLFLEDPNRAGVAGAMVALLDRGTAHRDHAAVAALLESNGAALGYGLTAENLVFRARCLSEDFALVLEILGETLREPAFPDDQLALIKEETLINLRELAFDTHERALRRAAGRLLGPVHPYARDPSGDERVVESLRREEIVAHHGRVMRASALMLAIVGDIAADSALELLDSHIGTIPAGTPASGFELPRPVPAGGAIHGTAGASIAREHVEIPDKEQVDIVVMGPGIARCDPDYEIYGVADFIFGGTFVSRLNQRLRDDDGLTYGAHSAILSGRESGVWTAATSVAPSSVDRAVDAMLEEMRGMAAGGPSAEELEIARDHLTGSFPLRIETNRQIGAALLDGVRHGRGLDYVDRYRDRIRAITREEVKAASARLFRAADAIVVTAGTRVV